MNDENSGHDPVERTTLSGRLPERLGDPAPAGLDPVSGQHRDYWILSEAERAKGFVRPVRLSYVHIYCGTVTTMGREIAETFARDPEFYGRTFCVCCRGHFPVGQFTWEGTDERVGS